MRALYKLPVNLLEHPTPNRYLWHVTLRLGDVSNELHFRSLHCYLCCAAWYHGAICMCLPWCASRRRWGTRGSLSQHPKQGGVGDVESGPEGREPTRKILTTQPAPLPVTRPPLPSHGACRSEGHAHTPTPPIKARIASALGLPSPMPVRTRGGRPRAAGHLRSPSLDTSQPAHDLHQLVAHALCCPSLPQVAFPSSPSVSVGVAFVTTPPLAFGHNGATSTSLPLTRASSSAHHNCAPLEPDNPRIRH